MVRVQITNMEHFDAVMDDILSQPNGLELQQRLLTALGRLLTQRQWGKDVTIEVGYDFGKWNFSLTWVRGGVGGEPFYFGGLNYSEYRGEHIWSVNS